MNCNQARRLFGPCWDDEMTQAEREWLESHFASCHACRTDYDAFSRALELAGTLPRVEAAPDLVERVTARARRLSPAPDRMGRVRPQWVPITAAAALVAIAGLLAGPWLGLRPAPTVRSVAVETAGEPASSPVAVAPPTSTPASRPETVELRRAEPTHVASPTIESAVATIPDSLFDHTDDVEFILDPVTLRHGRASVARPSGRAPVQGQQAIITF